MKKGVMKNTYNFSLSMTMVCLSRKLDVRCIDCTGIRFLLLGGATSVFMLIMLRF